MNVSHASARGWAGMILALVTACASAHPSAPVEPMQVSESVPNQVAPLWIEPGRPDLGAWVSTTIERQAAVSASAPVYSFTIGMDGSVRYRGAANTRVAGHLFFDLDGKATRSVGLLSRPFLELKANE